MSRTADRSNQSAHTRRTGEAPPWRRRIRVASVGATVGAIAVMGSLMLTSHQESSAATVVSAVVPGRVRSDTRAPTASTPADMPGMDMGGSSTGAAASRPLAPVLGTFGGGTAAVLLTAGMLRRKDQAADLVKKAARISGRARK